MTTTDTTKTETTRTATACRCGCGLPTITTEARYLPGHDARHAGNLIRAWAGATGDDEARQQITEAAQRELATAGLIAKFERGITRAAQQETERGERTAQRERDAKYRRETRDAEAARKAKARATREAERQAKAPAKRQRKATAKAA